MMLAGAAAVHGDVIINTAVTTAQQGDGGLFTVNSGGSIDTASNDGITAGSGTAITTLTVNGPVTSLKTGVLNDASTIGTITNSSTITGTDEHGIVARNGGAITTLTNNAAGTITGDFRGIYALSANTTIGTITNSGTITGTGQAGIQLDQGATITKITNSGTIRGDRGIWQNAISAANQGEITEVENLSGGLISGDVQWGYDNNGYTGTITNNINATIYGLRAGIVSFQDDLIDKIDNKAGGTIEGGANGAGILNYSEITALENAGTVTGGQHGVYVEYGTSLIDTLTNSGTITGTNFAGIRVGGSLGSGGAQIPTLTNTGTIEGQRGISVDGGGTITTLDNQAAGVINGTGSGGNRDGVTTFGTITGLTNAGSITGATHGVYVEYNAGALVGTLTNSGTITGTSEAGIRVGGNGATLTTLNNTGSIGGARGIFVNGGGTITTLENQTVGAAVGQISSAGNAIDNSGAIVTLTNDATISGNNAIFNTSSGVIGTLTNNETITATDTGIKTYGEITSLANTDSITGGQSGVYVEYNANAEIGLLTNSGTITGTNVAGIHVGGSGATLTSATNTGTIGGNTGVVVQGGGLFTKLTNSDTITGTSGNAIRVAENGVFGDATGAGGVAIASTGASAAITGSIENQGTIHYGFTIENQNLTVSGGGGTTGSFSNGTLTVSNGNLTFTNGRTFLGADVSVNGGTGTIFNQGTVAFDDQLSFDGLFSQSAGGTLSTLVAGTSTFGSIVIDESATFAGTLDLDLVNGFDFSEGETYLLFSFDSYTGDFFNGLSVDGQALTEAGTDRWNHGDLILEEVWTPTTMSLSVTAVPEPSTVALGAAGFAGAAWGLVHRPRRRPSGG